MGTSNQSLATKITFGMGAVRQVIQILETDVAAANNVAFLCAFSPRAITALTDDVNQHLPGILTMPLLRVLCTHTPPRSQIMAQLVVESPIASTNTIIILDELALLLASDARNHPTPVDHRLNVLSQYDLAICTTQQKLTEVWHSLNPVLVLCDRAASAVASTPARRLHARLMSYAILQILVSHISDDVLHMPRSSHC